MNIFIRADASVEIGTGHVMRCLTLAERLRGQGAEVAFISRSHEGNLNKWIFEEKKFTVYELPIDSKWKNGSMKNQTLYEKWLGTSLEKDAYETLEILTEQVVDVDWLIVDHYALDEQWERQLRPYTREIMVIDDLANRKHDCDVLLDQNLYKDMKRRYIGLIPDHCQTFLGPSFALLRQEFLKAKKLLNTHNGIVRRMLIFFGGSDPTNETMKALDALSLLQPFNITIDVVVGGANPHREKVEKKCRSMSNINYYCQIDNMAELMLNADLVLGAGGGSIWERCYLGVPSIVISVADNQTEVSQIADELGAVLFLGMNYNIDAKELANAIRNIVANPTKIISMHKNSIQLMNNSTENKVFEMFYRSG